MIQNLIWAPGYNIVALPLAAGALYAWGVLLTPAVGTVFMSASTVIVAINARMLRLKTAPEAEGQEPGKGAPAKPKSHEGAKEKPTTKKDPRA